MPTNFDAHSAAATPDHRADADEDRHPAQHHRDHAARLRAERHADPDLGAAPADRVRRHAVEAQTGEQQRQPAEEARSPATRRSCTSAAPTGRPAAGT